MDRTGSVSAPLDPNGAPWGRFERDAFYRGGGEAAVRCSFRTRMTSCAEQEQPRGWAVQNQPADRYATHFTLDALVRFGGGLGHADDGALCRLIFRVPRLKGFEAARGKVDIEKRLAA